jgi:hypothetical protein
MRRNRAKRKYSIGELVMAAYQKASRETDNPQVASIIASRTLENWLASSNHPELVAQLQSSFH